MKTKLCIASLLLMSGWAQADTVEWDYTNTLTGSITELLSGSPIAGNAVTSSQAVTGTLDIALMVNNTNNSLSLVSYNVDLVMSNGVTFSGITGSDLTNPAFLTSTGAKTCASASFEINGCITLNPNMTALLSANSTDPQGANLLLVAGGAPADQMSYSNTFCTGVPAYVTVISGTSNGVCSAGLGSSTAGQWTTKSTTPVVGAPELDAATAPALLSLLGGLVLVARGRRITPRKTA